MSSIATSYMPLNFNDNINASAAGSLSQGAVGTAFSDTLSMAEMALSPMAGGQASGFEAALSLTDRTTQVNPAAADNSFSQIFALLQEMVSGVETAQGGTSQTSASASSGSASDGFSPGALQLMQEGGPLPTFLYSMDTHGGLSATQQQSLWNIAAENMSNPNTQTIAAELQKAGISETIPSTVAV